MRMSNAPSGTRTSTMRTRSTVRMAADSTTAALLSPKRRQQAQQRGAQRLQLVRARQLRPMFLDELRGRVRHWPDGLAALCEEHQPRAAIVRVRAPIDVAHALQLIDRLSHRLL